MKEVERVVDIYESVIEQIGDIFFVLSNPMGVLAKAKDGTITKILNKDENRKVFKKLERVRKRYLTKDYRYVKRKKVIK
jgi:hypothetical protein